MSFLFSPKSTWELKVFPASPLLKKIYFYKKRTQLHEAESKMVNHLNKSCSLYLFCIILEANYFDVNRFKTNDSNFNNNLN